MAEKEEPLLTWKSGSVRVSAYENRIEMRIPKVLTLGLTHRTETIYYSSIRDMDVKARSIRIHLGAASVRQVDGSKKEIRALADLINSHR